MGEKQVENRYSQVTERRDILWKLSITSMSVGATCWVWEAVGVCWKETRLMDTYLCVDFSLIQRELYVRSPGSAFTMSLGSPKGPPAARQ